MYVYTKYYLWSIIKSKKMTYLHTITDKEGNNIENVYSNSESPKLSLKTLKKVVNGEYKVWNRNDWTFKII